MCPLPQGGKRWTVIVLVFIYAAYFVEKKSMRRKKKTPEKYRRHIYKVRSIEFKDNVLNIYAERSDETGHAVSKQLSSVYDLVAEEERYHDECKK